VSEADINLNVPSLAAVTVRNPSLPVDNMCRRTRKVPTAEDHVGKKRGPKRGSICPKRHYDGVNILPTVFVAALLLVLFSILPVLSKDCPVETGSQSICAPLQGAGHRGREKLDHFVHQFCPSMAFTYDFAGAVAIPDAYVAVKESPSSTDVERYTAALFSSRDVNGFFRNGYLEKLLHFLYPNPPSIEDLTFGMELTGCTGLLPICSSYAEDARSHEDDGDHRIVKPCEGTCYNVQPILDLASSVAERPKELEATCRFRLLTKYAQACDRGGVEERNTSTCLQVHQEQSHRYVDFESLALSRPLRHN